MWSPVVGAFACSLTRLRSLVSTHDTARLSSCHQGQDKQPSGQDGLATLLAQLSQVQQDPRRVLYVGEHT